MKRSTKKTFKSLVLCMLVLVLAVSSAACGTTPKNESGTSQAGGVSSGAVSTQQTGGDDPLTIDVFSGPSNYMGVQGGWYGKLVKDKFNLELNIIAPNVAGGGTTLYQTRSAAGDLGDIVVISKNELKDCVKAGLILDISDYIDKSTYLKNFQTPIDGLKNYLETDKVYGIPTNSSLESAMKPSFYGTDPYDATYLRFDYFNEIGAPDLKTYEDVIEALKQMQANHPETESGAKTWGFSFFKDWDGDYMKEAHCIVRTLGYAMDGGTGFLMTNGDGSDARPIDEDGGAYYRALEILFNANQAGLVDPDSSAQSWDDYVAKVKDGAVLFSTWPWASIDHYNNTGRENAGEGFTFVPVDECKYFTDGYNPYGSDNNVMAIGANCENPERVLEFLDWYASPENTNCYDACMGPQGILWDVVDGQCELTEEGSKFLDDMTGYEAPADLGGGNWKKGAQQLNTLIQYPGDTNPETGEGYYYSSWKSTIENGRTALDEAWTERYGAKNPMELLMNGDQMEIKPGSDYVQPEQPSELGTKRASCKDAIVNTSWQMVFAKDKAEFDQLWKDMKEQLVGLGYEDCLAFDKDNVELYKASKAEAMKGE